MVWIPGGTFQMGSDGFYPEEQPVRDTAVDGFWMDATPVTNLTFARFVRATGHRTLAERQPDSSLYPTADPALVVAGSLVFAGSPGPVPLDDPRRWWRFAPGASWRHPEGPGSNLNGRDRHPVVHVGLDDAHAYAAWAGKAVPTEAEWERAARGGIEGATYPWGEEPTPRGRHMANTWQGPFPWRDDALDGFAGTSPVGAFPPNGYGLYDMVGNVWEWTTDAYDEPRDGGNTCCTPDTVQTPARLVAEGAFSRHVIKGGSHLCAESYCLRYRPAARQGEAIDTTTSHIGFRCVLRTSL